MQIPLSSLHLPGVLHISAEITSCSLRYSSFIYSTHTFKIEHAGKGVRLPPWDGGSFILVLLLVLETEQCILRAIIKTEHEIQTLSNTGLHCLKA